MLSSQTKLGLALSGGGFRAAAFHLGVLKRLEELRILQHVQIVSAVSGGAITGALYALRCAQSGDGTPGSYSVDALIQEMEDVFRTNLRRRALFGSVARTCRTAASFLIRPVRRMPNFVDELDRQLFRGATLDELPPWILINATNLSTGKGWKFFHDRAGDYLIGATDRTGDIRVAEAVGASAAYPVLVDPLPFHTRWEYLRADLLDRRWQRPPVERPGEISGWRKRFGATEGRLVLPLADGGLYDNEGLNGLRSAGVTHAIYSSSSSPPDDFTPGYGLHRMARVVEVIHNRLSDVTRQHAHEMTHGVHPSDARSRLLRLADDLQSGSNDLSDVVRLRELAEVLRTLSDVGWPPRGHQFTSVAPVLLHRSDLAKNVSASFTPAYDVPPEHRGLSPRLVEELARVRTDLDAYDSDLTEVLMAQAYLLTDYHVKIALPEVLNWALGTSTPLLSVLPSWTRALEAVSQFNSNEEYSVRQLGRESKRKWLLGHTIGARP